MARKTILTDLMGQALDMPAPESPPHHKTRAIGAVSKSIADLKTRAIIEIDPSKIEAGGMRDRLGRDVEAHKGLVESLRAHGQQVPVLVRPHPETSGLYQIVYGRRRVHALRELDVPVKAMVRDLDDQALVIAQGQENTARLDLSFIEKANFARQMRDAGYKGTAISSALSVDKTLVSRMLKIADAVPVALIEAIGAASGVGRPRWAALADKLEAVTPAKRDAILNLLQEAKEKTSEERFSLVLLELERGKPKPEQSTSTPDEVKVSRSSGRVQLALPDDAFAEWLVQSLPELRKSFDAKS